MILQIDGWKFDVDVAATMEYSAKEALEHCDCGYCRNYYEAVDTVYPELQPFLAEFGIYIEAPDELMPYDVGEEMYYDGVYAVCGRILTHGKTPITRNGLTISPESGPSVQINHSCPQPCFFLSVGTMILPWVLDEPMGDVRSPANLPPFIKKMTDKLLRRSDDTPIS